MCLGRLALYAIAARQISFPDVCVNIAPSSPSRARAEPLKHISFGGFLRCQTKANSKNQRPSTGRQSNALPMTKPHHLLQSQKKS